MKARKVAQNFRVGFTCSLLFTTFVSFLCFTSASPAAPTPVAQNVVRLGKFSNNDIDESSGLVASRKYANVFWTHNDSGNSSRLFATTRTGAKLGTYRLQKIKLRDWEDIAIDDSGNLYFADIGDANTERKVLAVYEVREPNPYQSGEITVRKSWQLKFLRDASYDSEAFVVANGYGYVITKERFSDRALIYRFSLNGKSPITLSPVSAVPIGANITGASLSRDRKRLALISDQGAFLFVINGDISAASRVQPVFTAFNRTGMEGAAFAGTGLLVCAESGDLYLFNRPAFRVW